MDGLSGAAARSEKMTTGRKQEMLKGIPKILSPELLKVLAEMGHSDRLVISDGNFPAESMGKDAIVIRCDGHGVPEILDAILQVFPLDTYVEKPVNLMEVMPGDTVELTVELIHPIAIEQGTKFSIREGGRTVGSGNISEIIE